MCGEGSRDGHLGRFEGTSRATSATGKVKAKEADSSWEVLVMLMKRGLSTSKEKESSIATILPGKDLAEEATLRTSLATL